MTNKLTIAALALGLALPVAAATTATITAPTELLPCVAGAQDVAPQADPTCTPIALGANIIPFAGGTDAELEAEDEEDEDGDND